MILVTGASGQTGRAVVDLLVAAGAAVRAFDIAPEVKELGDRGQVEVVEGDMTDAASVREALDGVRTVVHIGPVLHPREAEMGLNVVSEAGKAEVGHFVFFSVLHPQLQGLPNHAAKLEVEQHLLLSRLPFTILQPTYYMQNVRVDLALAGGVLRQPFSVDARIGMVDLEDVAIITAQVVSRSEKHRFATYQLCGADARSSVEMAEVITVESGRAVEAACTRPMADREPVLGSNGAGDFRAHTLLRLVDHYERYGIVGNQNVLTWLLGRRPTTFAEYVRRCLAGQD